MFWCHANKSDPTYDLDENVFNSSKTKVKKMEKIKKTRNEKLRPGTSARNPNKS